MVFGRKKKQEQEIVEDAAPNQEEDLVVAYGNVDEANDELSVTDSIPPPPPAGQKNEDSSQEDSPTESPSANDEADDSVDEKKEVGQIKRRKLLLIATCVVSFFILLGLAIKYGQVQKQSSANEASTLDSPATTVTVPSIPSSTLVDEGTPAPSTNATDAGTVAACVANDVTVLTTCDDEGATVTFDFCLIDDMADQFWEWVSTPQLTPQVVTNEWAWLRDGLVAEFAFPLADGTYEIGLFSNGEEQLRQYPLLNSTVFTVDCSE